jgi:hypothetical protein
MWAGRGGGHMSPRDATCMTTFYHFKAKIYIKFWEGQWVENRYSTVHNMKEPRNRIPAWWNRFMGFLNVYRLRWRLPIPCVWSTSIVDIRNYKEPPWNYVLWMLNFIFSMCFISLLVWKLTKKENNTLIYKYLSLSAALKSIHERSKY